MIRFLGCKDRHRVCVEVKERLDDQVDLSINN